MKSPETVQSADHVVAKTVPKSSDVQAWHVLSFEAVREILQTDVVRGLTQSEAARRLTQYGGVIAGCALLPVAVVELIKVMTRVFKRNGVEHADNGLMKGSASPIAPRKSAAKG